MFYCDPKHSDILRRSSHVCCHLFSSYMISRLCIKGAYNHSVYLGRSLVLKAIVNLFRCEKNMQSFLFKNTPLILWCKKNYFFLLSCFPSLLSTFVFVSLQTLKLSFCSSLGPVYMKNPKRRNEWVRKKMRSENKRFTVK